ncbi:class I SAM-dependent rRNA methyltransferase [Pseudothermotoga elfii]
MNKFKRNHHPWIYKNEIMTIKGDFEDGQIVDVFLKSGQFFARGYINTKSKITVRILTFEPKTIEQILQSRIEQAIHRRRFLLKHEQACRLIYSESDWLAGLIVDKFGPYLVIQINTLGMEKLKELSVKILLQQVEVSGIYEKSDSPARLKEGLEKRSGWIYGNGPEIIYYRSNGLTLASDLKGQKTGAFLDQRLNARALFPYAEGKECVDVFSYTGNFALHLLKYGAKHVKLIDYSQRSLQIADQLMKLNGFEGRYDLICANAFDWLKRETSLTEQYDLIVLDPPSFAKTSSAKESAERGHKEVNLRAIKLLKKPGLLVSSSCTQILSAFDFERVMQSVASDCKVNLRIACRGGQPEDHPILLGVPETEYLKFYIFEAWRRD